MIMIPPIAITDSNFVSSSVPDLVEVLEVKATGSITVNSVTAHVYATGWISFSSDPALGDTFTIGAQTFTVVTTRSGTGQVTRSTASGTMRDNMVTAITADISSVVTAVNNDSKVNLTAIATGAGGNSISLAVTGTFTRSGTSLSGGTDPVPAINDTFIVGPTTFTFKLSGTATGDVVLNGTGTSAQATNIKTSLDRDVPDIVTTSRTDNVVSLTAVSAGTLGNDTDLTESASGITVSGSGHLSGGVDYVAGYHEWDDETTYDIGDVVVVTTEHHLYESLRGTNLNNSPPTNLTGEDPYWLDLGPTNRWRMFDPPYTHTYNAVVASRTVQAESIVVALTPGAIDAVALINCNASSINITLNDGTERYNKTITPVSTAARNYTALDLPDDYPTATLAVTITNTGANATCGVLVCGLQKDMGTTRANPGPEIGIIDYSIKEQDDFGNWSITPRDNAKRNTYGILIPVADHSEVKRLLAEYRSTPVVWDGNGANTDYSILRNYGLVSDWDMHVTNGFAELSLEIEGLT
jgi:hypothetical protein